MDEKFKQWRARGKHLPPNMRDFHDQKEIFKTMHEMYRLTGSNPKDGDNVNAVDGHIYVVDAFLWFMAQHGYTLQKSRADQTFNNLNKTVEQYRQHRDEQFSKLLKMKKSD